jgi:NAD(P)-dependent dehydrogenase (short-subunit alcohol dehydrogenase family)
MTKNILIIGASGGLGTEMVKFFAEKNYRLALHYHDNPPADSSFKSFQADIRKEDEVESLIQNVIADLGRVDVVINNAGISKNAISWKADIENWNETIGVNLTGPFLVCKHLIPYMREQNFGRIIFMSSVVAETGMVGASAYAASKSGLFGLTKSLSRELANKEITVNAVALGYFNTGMIDDVSKELQEELKRQIPKNELGQPLELAHLIEYIISDNASYLTGQTLNLNGGLYG